MADAVTRIDLHLHSRASGTATNWWVKGLGSGLEAWESYTDPEDAYRMAREAGMDFVTLTDHETIEGALGLSGKHADFIVGEEVCARFPEDGSQVDILVYGLDEEDHREIQARRSDVYLLVSYLREAGLVYVLAHPVYGLPETSPRAAVERRLLLFGLWEFVNGSRPAAQNRLARELAEGVGLLELRQMAGRCGLPVPPHRRVRGTGGSDDHGGLYGGKTFTLLPRVSGPEELLEALAAGECEPAGADGSADRLTHTALRIAGGALREGESWHAARLLQRLSPAGRLHPARSPGGLRGRLPLLSRLPEAGMKGELIRRYEDRIAGALQGLGSGFPALDLLGVLGGVLEGHGYIAPYVALHGYFGRETERALHLRRGLLPARSGEVRVGVFVDGLDGVHGVATMYRNIESIAGGRALRIVRCREELKTVARVPVPFYGGLELEVPSLVSVLEHVTAEGYDTLHVATPGPLGLAALVAGLVLRIPVVGAYHTELGTYARMLSGDHFVAGMVEVAVREFYERCAAVAVPSRATSLSLRARGYRIRRFELLQNGVDGDLFNPGRRDGGLHRALGSGRKLLLYVGRLSREKGLEEMATGYLRLRRRRDDVHLVLAGEGPLRRDLEWRLGEAATFTGLVEGEELARIFASCDVFVFPSLTDTLGRAVLEAQASGIPAVVYGSGGPSECVIPGESGFVADPGDEEGFFSLVEALLDDASRRRRMGRAARRFARSMQWEAVAGRLLALHAELAHGERSVAPV
ncbi:D-inositol-3-phosphate glycosyltransferase [Rubrobacter xylanophilus DSM 9941]|uniref:glycosyltransferase n=1 Tax=Rubrobacter xylanophilus TaxID=49319 RepID=UPI001C644028|nr:glycosyltransferase [Rubrobacter xylanophilus]QYJ16535.1 D-inositol-3-phosphate glycosyltransferase [Rubrobacter xylanophilus DSM 9941]